jgi:hypothetical protein
MANAHKVIGNLAGVVDATDADVRAKLTGDDDLTTLADMRTALQVIDGDTYSDAELNHMTYNDMMYALLLNDTPNSLGPNH